MGVMGVMGATVMGAALDFRVRAFADDVFDVASPTGVSVWSNSKQPEKVRTS